MKNFNLVPGKHPSVTDVTDVNGVVLAHITPTRNNKFYERHIVRLVDIPYYVREVRTEDDALLLVGRLLDSLPEPKRTVVSL
jgi:hypothetical protein